MCVPRDLLFKNTRVNMLGGALQELKVEKAYLKVICPWTFVLLA